MSFDIDWNVVARQKGQAFRTGQQDWKSMERELRSLEDAYASRRMREANHLSTLSTAVVSH